MAANANRASQVFTSHGTSVFVDTSSGEVRHGALERSPNNIVLVQLGSQAYLRFVDSGVEKEISYLADYSAVIGSNKLGGFDVLNSLSGNRFKIVNVTDREFGLEQNGIFLCAEPDGRITLSRSACEIWERFHLREDASESSGTIISHRIDGKIVSFFISNGDDYIQSFLIRGDFYERPELDLIKRLSPPGKVFVDIGANIGNHSIFMSKFCSPSEVIVFEPNPKAIEILKINLALNGCANVNPAYLGLALSSESNLADVFYPISNNMGQAQMLKADHGAIKCIPGDVFLRQKPIGFIKIDVEGAEFDVLKGIQETVELWRPGILIEVWPERHQELVSWCDAFRYAVKETFPLDNNFFLAPIER
ncbi:FkbM family methyltransferase [Mesorhizobium sp. Cs1321R2N1]|uniref:FkbM family methyltransferase n=1 Tax=Mesorhizobium sp. Cs1321R2N1 TaxID=3015174 RepID=UPI00301BBC9E